MLDSHEYPSFFTVHFPEKKKERNFSLENRPFASLPESPSFVFLVCPVCFVRRSRSILQNSLFFCFSLGLFLGKWEAFFDWEIIVSFFFSVVFPSSFPFCARLNFQSLSLSASPVGFLPPQFSPLNFPCLNSHSPCSVEKFLSREWDWEELLPKWSTSFRWPALPFFQRTHWRAHANEEIFSPPLLFLIPQYFLSPSLSFFLSFHLFFPSLYRFHHPHTTSLAVNSCVYGWERFYLRGLSLSLLARGWNSSSFSCPELLNECAAREREEWEYHMEWERERESGEWKGVRGDSSHRNRRCLPKQERERDRFLFHGGNIRLSLAFSVSASLSLPHFTSHTDPLERFSLH